MIEALAMELPVIARGVSGVLELVQHKMAGLLRERGVADESAFPMGELAENPEGAKTLGKNARRLIVEQYGVKSSVGLLVHAHCDILAGGLAQLSDVLGTVKIRRRQASSR